MIGALVRLLVSRTAQGSSFAWILFPVVVAAVGVRIGPEHVTAGPLNIDVDATLLTLIPGGYALGFAVVVIGQDVATGAISFLLDTPVSRWYLALYSAGAAAVATAVVSVPLALLATSPHGVLRVALSAVVYASLFTGLVVVTRRDILAGVIFLVAWEIVGAQLLEPMRWASVRYCAASVANITTPGSGESLPDRAIATTVLLAITVAGVSVAAWALARHSELRRR